jgi:hypothetical protein
MNYRIKASDVAAIVGKNPYKSREDVLFQYIHGKSKDDIAFESALTEQPEETQELIKNTIQQSKREDILNTEEKIQALPEKVKEYVKHEIYKNNGTHRERKVAEAHNVKRDTKWYSMRITEDVRLVGLIDGRRGEDSIIEIKNRQKRLFGYVPLYEYIQCQVYMKLTGTEKCTLIEQFGDESNSFDLEFSYTMWELEILPALRAFAHEITEEKSTSSSPSSVK